MSITKASIVSSRVHQSWGHPSFPPAYLVSDIWAQNFPVKTCVLDFDLAVEVLRQDLSDPRRSGKLANASDSNTHHVRLA